MYFSNMNDQLKLIEHFFNTKDTKEHKLQRCFNFLFRSLVTLW